MGRVRGEPGPWPVSGIGAGGAPGAGRRAAGRGKKENVLARSGRGVGEGTIPEDVAKQDTRHHLEVESIRVRTTGRYGTSDGPDANVAHATLTHHVEAQHTWGSKAGARAVAGRPDLHRGRGRGERRAELEEVAIAVHETTRSLHAIANFAQFCLAML